MTNSFARLERVAGKNPHQSSWCGLCMLYQSSKSQLIREHVHGMISHFSNQGASLHYNFFRFRDAHATIDTSFRSVMVLRKSRAWRYFFFFFFFQKLKKTFLWLLIRETRFKLPQNELMWTRVLVPTCMMSSSTSWTCVSFYFIQVHY